MERSTALKGRLPLQDGRGSAAVACAVEEATVIGRKPLAAKGLTAILLVSPAKPAMLLLLDANGFPAAAMLSLKGPTLTYSGVKCAQTSADHLCIPVFDCGPRILPESRS